MHFKLLNPGKYLGAADFESPDWKHGKEPTLTIRKVVLEQMEGEAPKGPDGKPMGEAPKEMKGMISVDESPKGWLMNVTNARCLAAMFGNETNSWIGKRVALHCEQVMSFGEWVPGVRIHGSPDLAADVAVTIKMRKKKTQTITLKKLGAAHTKSNGAPKVYPPTGTVDFGPRKGTQIPQLTHDELKAAIALGQENIAKAAPGAGWLPKTQANVDELLADQQRRAKLEEQMSASAPPSPAPEQTTEPLTEDAPF